VQEVPAAQLGVVIGDAAPGKGVPRAAALDRGADRWSGQSVRGSQHEGVVLPPGQWRLDEQDGSLVLHRPARDGQFLR
jgi:hypothetical protein